MGLWRLDLSSVKELIKRHWQLIVFILGLISVFCLVWALRNVLLPFIVGLILASLILPVIQWVEKHFLNHEKKPKVTQFKRITIILLIYLLALAFIGAIIFYIIAVMGKSLMAMAQDAPQIIPNGLAAITNWLKSLPILASQSVQQQIDTYSTQAGVALGNALKDLLSGSATLVQSSTSMILGFAIMPMFTFFLLKDWGKLRDRFYAALPVWARTHMIKILAVVQRVLGRYIRGQLILAAAVGLCAGILLFTMRIEFALPLAVFAGITELVPMIGPWLGGGLAVIVTLATAPEKVIWVGLGFLVIQLLENNLLVPKIQGSQMEIHPAFIILLSVLGAHFAGIIGFIIVLPLTMTVMGLFKYLRTSTRNSSIS